jgi:hypothetical protein
LIRFSNSFLVLLPIPILLCLVFVWKDWVFKSVEPQP